MLIRLTWEVHDKGLLLLAIWLSACLIKITYSVLHRTKHQIKSVNTNVQKTETCEILLQTLQLRGLAQQLNCTLCADYHMHNCTVAPFLISQNMKMHVCLVLSVSLIQH